MQGDTSLPDTRCGCHPHRAELRVEQRDARDDQPCGSQEDRRQDGAGRARGHRLRIRVGDAKYAVTDGTAAALLPRRAERRRAGVTEGEPSAQTLKATRVVIVDDQEASGLGLSDTGERLRRARGNLSTSARVDQPGSGRLHLRS